MENEQDARTGQGNAGTSDERHEPSQSEPETREAGPAEHAPTGAPATPPPEVLARAAQLGARDAGPAPQPSQATAGAPGIPPAPQHEAPRMLNQDGDRPLPETGNLSAGGAPAALPPILAVTLEAGEEEGDDEEEEGEEG